jgi:ABC-type hemin transport system substrate-binding protein
LDASIAIAFVDVPSTPVIYYGRPIGNKIHLAVETLKVKGSAEESTEHYTEELKKGEGEKKETQTRKKIVFFGSSSHLST